MADSILPCPFCNAPGRMRSNSNSANVECSGEECCAEGPLTLQEDGYFLQKAIKAWNTRAQPADFEPKPVLKIAGGDVIPEAKILHGDWRALPHGTELFTHPAPAGVVLPPRRDAEDYPGYIENFRSEAAAIYNACREETARLNGVQP